MPEGSKLDLVWKSFRAYGADGADFFAFSNDLLLVGDVIDSTGEEVLYQFLSDSEIYVSIGQSTVIDGIAYASGYYFPSRRDSKGGAYFAAFDLINNEVIWAQHAKEAAPPFSSPVVVEDNVYFITSSLELLKTSRSSGKLRLRIPIESRSGNSSPGSTNGIAAYASGHLFVGGLDQHLHCVDVDSGYIRWSFDVKDDLYAIPTHAKERAFIVGYRVLHAIDAQTGELVWKQDIAKPWHSSTATDQSRVFVVGGDVLHAFDQEDGELLWTVPILSKTLDDDPSSPRCAPIIVADEVIVGGRDGAVYVFEASTGRVRRRIDVSSLAQENVRDVRSVAVVDGMLYVLMGYSIIALTD